MAPANKASKSSKGKARIFMCSACGVRHVSPTGSRCPHSRSIQMAAPDATSRPTRRSTRKVPGCSSDSDFLILAGGTVRRMRSGMARDQSSSDDETDIGDLLGTIPGSPVPTTSTQIPPVSNVDAAVYRPPLPTPGHSVVCSAEATVSTPTNAILEQIKLMQAESRREMARIEQQGRLDRAALEASIQDMTSRLLPANPVTTLAHAGTSNGPVTRTAYTLPRPLIPRSLSATGEMVDASNAPTLGGASDTRGPQPSTSGLAHGFTVWRVVPPNFIERLTAREVPACTDRRPQQITAEQLSEAPRPVKRLRRDSASAAAAKELLKEIGYVASKGNCASDKNIEAPWPEDYIDRLDGSEPTYESLSLSEFIAGYLSIMEESVPFCQQTQPIIRHIHYLRGLMEDCFETDWQTVRTAHKQVLHAIEHGRVSWEDTRSCLDTKTNAIQRVLRIVSQNLKQNTKQSDNVVNPCPLFQSLSCNLPAEHATKGITYTHCCAYCMRRFNNRTTHAEMNCRKKPEADNRRTKNAKRRRRPQRE